MPDQSSDIEIEAAYQRGREAAALRATVDAHQERLDRINGSVERHAKANEQLASDIRDLRQTVSDLAHKLTDTAEISQTVRTLADKVNKAEIDQEAYERAISELKDAKDHTIGRWGFIAGTIATIAAVLGLIIAILQYAPHA